MNELLLDTPGVAAVLGCSVSGVRKLSAAGRLPAPVRCGRLLRWRASELAAWIEAGLPSRERWETLKAAGRKAVA